MQAPNGTFFNANISDENFSYKVLFVIKKYLSGRFQQIIYKNLNEKKIL